MVKLKTISNEPFWSLGNINYMIFFVGLLAVLLGYIIMSQGEVYSFQSLNLAPILLFLGYIILIPLALIIDNSSKKKLKRDRSSVG